MTETLLHGKVLRVVEGAQATLFFTSDQARTLGPSAATTLSSTAPPPPSTPHTRPPQRRGARHGHKRNTALVLAKKQ